MNMLKFNPTVGFKRKCAPKSAYPNAVDKLISGAKTTVFSYSMQTLKTLERPFEV